jgi:hypothetical protein
VEYGEKKCNDCADAGAALDEGFVALDAQLELAQSAGLSVADESMHFGLEDGEVG